jgi:hypothetical protein
MITDYDKAVLAASEALDTVSATHTFPYDEEAVLRAIGWQELAESRERAVRHATWAESGLLALMLAVEEELSLTDHHCGTDLDACVWCGISWPCPMGRADEIMASLKGDVVLDPGPLP